MKRGPTSSQQYGETPDCPEMRRLIEATARVTLMNAKSRRDRDVQSFIKVFIREWPAKVAVFNARQAWYEELPSDGSRSHPEGTRLRDITFKIMVETMLSGLDAVISASESWESMSEEVKELVRGCADDITAAKAGFSQILQRGARPIEAMLGDCRVIGGVAMPDKERQWLFQIAIRGTDLGQLFLTMVHQHLARIPGQLLPLTFEVPKEFVSKEELELEELMRPRLPKFLQFPTHVREKARQRIAKGKGKARQTEESSESGKAKAKGGLSMTRLPVERPEEPEMDMPPAPMKRSAPPNGSPFKGKVAREWGGQPVSSAGAAVANVLEDPKFRYQPARRAGGKSRQPDGGSMVSARSGKSGGSTRSTRSAEVPRGTRLR